MPAIGSMWPVEVLAPDNTLVFLAASLQPGSGAPTPFGSLQVDLPNAVTVATAVDPPGSHDPQATLSVPIPNAPHLLGTQVWVQALAAPPSLAPRLTNGILAVVQ